MALFYYYGSGDLGDQAIRLGEGFSFTECADSGILAMSRIQVDDPAGSLDLVGHHGFHVDETACSWLRLFHGYFADRTIKRDKSLLTGAARVWDCTVYDINAAAQFEVIQGASAKRPAETDTARLAWLLGTSYLGPISSDDTSVFGAGVNLDEADYRGQTLVEVLTDCAQVSGNNWFVAWDQTLNSPVLHYYDPQRAYNSSTIKISNVLSDVDESTVFAPDLQWSLNKDPSRVFSGIYYQYGEKYSAVYETNATVLSNIGHKRETFVQDGSTRTSTKASARAQKALTEAETEYDTIAVTLRKVPPSVVNLIRAGQRIQVKATHFPGYTSYTWLRVTRRTVSQDGETQLFYQLELELSNPKQGLTKRRGGNPVPPDADDGASVGFTRKSFKAQEDRDDCQGGLANVYTFGVSPPASDQVASATLLATPGIFVGGGCSSPAVGYSGVDTVEQWLLITGTPSADATGIKVTYTTANVEGVAATQPLVYGYATADPTTYPGAFTPLGTCDSGGGSFVVPTSLVGNGDYIVLGPGWQAVNGSNVCSSSLPGGHPLDSGYANSGQLDVSSFSMAEVTVAGSGETLWRPLTGTIDGTNKTFGLPDWNGRGVPRLRIGPVEYALGTDYTVDRDALEATFTFAPWEGADLNGRWHV